MDCCSQPNLLPFTTARQQMLDSILWQQPIEQRALAAADLMVLASDVISPINVPVSNNSAMDGFAFRQQDLAEFSHFTLVGECFAGHPWVGELHAGQCIRIMTGAEVPDSATAVEMQENVQLDGNVVQFKQPVRLGQNIRLCGEDIRQGQTLFSRGHRIKAADLSVLASLGIAQVAVYKPLTVGLISTGDELQVPGNPLAAGQIYESNSASITALLQRLGCKVIDFGIIQDDFALIKAAFQTADQQCDLVISSGGVSVGVADYTKAVLDELGAIEFWKVAMKPGKPFAFGKLSNSYFIGLPGNPVSALVTLHQLGVAAIHKMAGALLDMPVQFTAIAHCAFKKGRGRTDFQRGSYFVDDHGVVKVQSLGLQGSHVFSSMSQANCYVVLEQDRGNVEVGESVIIQPFDRLLL